MKYRLVNNNAIVNRRLNKQKFNFHARHFVFLLSNVCIRKLQYPLRTYFMTLFCTPRMRQIYTQSLELYLGAVFLELKMDGNVCVCVCICVCECVCVDNSVTLCVALHFSPFQTQNKIATMQSTVLCVFVEWKVYSLLVPCLSETDLSTRHKSIIISARLRIYAVNFISGIVWASFNTKSVYSKC